MKIFTQNKTHNKILSFKSQYKPIVRKVNPEILKRADYLIPLVEETSLTLKKLEEKSKNSTVNKLLNYIKSELKLNKFNSEEKSLTFNNGKTNYIVKTNGKDSILLQEQDKITGAVTNSIQTTNRSITSQSESLKRVECVETFLQRFLDTIDFTLLKFRRITTKPENENILKNLKNFIDNKTSITKSDSTENLSRGILPQKILNEMSEIASYYNKIFENLSSIPNPGTRSRLKNDYHAILPSSRGSRIIGFQKDNYKLFVNYANDHLKEYLVLQRIMNDGNLSNFILGMNGKAYKQKALTCLKDKAKTVEYYTQEEIDSPEFFKILHETKKELINYSEYIQDRINLKNTRSERLTTTNIGSIGENNLQLIGNIKKTYQESKTTLATIHDKTKKNLAKDYFGIESRIGSPSFILRNVTNNHEDLQISFPVIDNKECTKILVLEGINEIKNSFFIIEDKLVKFEAKKLGRSARNDNKMNYFSQTEIDSFGLDNYLKTILKKLESINNGIKSKEYLK